MGENMVYRYEEYKKAFFVDLKSIQKNVASEKFCKYIFECLNSRKYSNIDMFYTINSTLNDFISSYMKSKNFPSFKHTANVLIHFSEGITEQEYQKIIKSIINYNAFKNKATNFVSLRELIANIDELNEQDRKYIRKIIDNIDDIDNVEVDLVNKIFINNANNNADTNSNTINSKQKNLSTVPGSKRFYENNEWY